MRLFFAVAFGQHTLIRAESREAALDLLCGEEEARSDHRQCCGNNEMVEISADGPAEILIAETC